MFRRSSTDSERSELQHISPIKKFNALSLSDDPRTISEIKRSRIDLDRRYVFLCPTSLSKQFDVLPQQAKDSALLVFKCSRDWLVRDPNDKSKKKSQSKVECGAPKNFKNKRAAPKAALSSAACHSEFPKEFMQFVNTKEKEGCIFWWKPEKDLQKLSKFLEEKIDPVSEHPYQPLLLDPHWWRVSFQRTTARYCNNPSIICSCISERSNAGVDKRDVAIHVLQELIYQSNPTLEPIAKWPHAPSMRFLPKAPTSNRDYVGLYASFKGFIDKSATPRDSAGLAQDQGRITQWPPVPQERRDDLQRAWEYDNILARRTFPDMSRSAPLSVREGGGLFGSKLGFGQGSPLMQRQRDARLHSAAPSLSPRRPDTSDALSTISPPGSARCSRLGL
jgi:hypothetical protein